jgi:exonuclease SbcD
MRLVHTSDWHLGHTLYDQPRAAEHARFLTWLLELLESERVDALLICGDVFDTANPSSESQAAWYGFLAQARRRCPALEVVVIGGNHDSPQRLDAPEPLLRSLSVRVVGGWPRHSASTSAWTPTPAELERVLVPLHDQRGRVAAHVAAVPFLRPSDLPRVEDKDESTDVLIEGVRRLYAGVLDAARARREPGEALIAMGHLYMAGTRISELSERKILGGNQHALPLELFPDDLAYVALGHLHLAQTVGGREHVRYSGSPLPLSLAETHARHEVLLVDIEGERASAITPVRVPVVTPMLRVPPVEAAPLADVIERLRSLPALDPSHPHELRPFLEVCVQLERPEPGLRRRVEEALVGKQARLVKLTPWYTGHERALAESVSVRSLRELSPEEVFLARYARDHEQPPSLTLLEAFHELISSVTQSERERERS